MSLALQTRSANIVTQSSSIACGAPAARPSCILFGETSWCNPLLRAACMQHSQRNCHRSHSSSSALKTTRHVARTPATRNRCSMHDENIQKHSYMHAPQGITSVSPLLQPNLDWRQRTSSPMSRRTCSPFSSVKSYKDSHVSCEMSAPQPVHS